MLNLFSYGSDDSDSGIEEVRPAEPVPTPEIPEEKSEKKQSNSLFGAVPKAKKGMSSKEKKLMTMAKFAKVSVEELKKELKEEEISTPVVAPRDSAKPKCALSFLPSPKHDAPQKTQIQKSTSQNEQEVLQSSSSISPKNKRDEEKASVRVDLDEDELVSGGAIPLNPFLSDAETIQSKKEEKADDISTPMMFKTVYRRKPQTSAKTTSQSSYASSSSVYSPTNAGNETSGGSGSGYGYGYGYSGNFSQSQYEAFIRRSGMLATAGAASSNSVELLGEDAKHYDKHTKKALEEGAIKELNQNDIHNHNDQPGSEYWEKRTKRQEVAKEFGKYAHIAPTQVQQTRNQITSLAAEAIVALAEADELRARRRKTQREIRAKYGW